MDKELLELLEQIKQLNDSHTNKSAQQKLIEAYAERKKLQDDKERKELEEYVGKPLSELDPLEIGKAKAEMVADKQDKARKELAENLAQLNQKKTKARNWLNQPIKDN